MAKPALKVLTPLLALVVAVAVSWWMIQTKPEPDKQPPAPAAPAVRVQKVAKADVRLTVAAQGVVQPRTETQLVAETPGKVLQMAPAMAAGGFFEAGDVLVRLDPADYELAVVQAESALYQARLALSMMQAEAEATREEWRRLGQGEGNPLAFKEPQLAEAQAALRSAEAGLKLARLNLARTVIKAPYPGRVRKEYVDVGQYVTKGFNMADIYAVDFAEVRLPLPDEKLAFIDIPIDYRNGGQHGQHAPVLIKARFGGRQYAWNGEVVRTEGELDPRSRMVIAVAQVKNPYGRGQDPGRPPLASGMYVEAEIQGRLAKGAVVLPRSVLRGADQVLVVGPDRRLAFRKVGVLMLERDHVVIDHGLQDGETVCLTQPEVAVEGMLVRVLAPAAGPAPAGRP